MLIELSITNLAIIDALRLTLVPGFNVLTGETGAGKSIIIDAMNLLLGERASTDMVRTGCAGGAVEGVFALAVDEMDELSTLLCEQGLEDDLAEETLILRREISRSRRNICRVNGRAVTLNVLQALGSHLVDIHGQGEHLSLLQPRRHVDFVDHYGGLWPERIAFGERVAALQAVRRELAALQQDERELARRIDLLRYQMGEIEAARLQGGEEATLRHQRNLLTSSERRLQLAAEAYEALYEGEDEQRAVVDLMGAVQEALTELARLDPAVGEVQGIAESCGYQLEDLARTVRDYRDDIEYEPDELMQIEERLDLITSLKLKYGDSISEVLAFAQRAGEELDTISHSEERIEELTARGATLLSELAEAGRILSAHRREAADRLSAAIEDELQQLGMAEARFSVEIAWRADESGVSLDGERYGFDATGIDRVEFFIAPNPGEDAKPLAKTASGGETSRLMLALKTALSTIDPVPTLIFDEIDTGIGGRVGSVVGEKLWTLAQDHQVFCVTHLAQIACYGAQHLRVSKQVVEGRTTSQAAPLVSDARISELAVMLGGVDTEATRHSAREMLQRVAQAGGSS